MNAGSAARRQHIALLRSLAADLLDSVVLATPTSENYPETEEELIHHLMCANIAALRLALELEMSHCSAN